MVVSGTSDQSRTTTKGYERLDQAETCEETNPVTDSEVEESGSDSSELFDSDSECGKYMCTSFINNSTYFTT